MDMIQQIAIHLVLIILSMAAWWGVHLRKLVTRTEVKEMLADNVINKSEISDMINNGTAVLNVRMGHLEDICKMLTSALERNTVAVNLLNVELAKMGSNKE